MEAFQLKVYNCSDPGENPIPFWMTQKAYFVEKTEEEPPSEPISAPVLPDFRYTSEPFFPEFCSVRHD
jgi:hypothetical protein